MNHRTAVIVLLIAALALPLCAADLATERPQIGKVEIFKASDLRPGMQGTAWTVFAGTEPEPVPVEILGLWKNAWGPRQDVILAKMGGKAVRTNVAGGMSGSPVYIDGKLVGAVALRLSVFARRDLRHHADRADAGDQRFRSSRGPPTRARPTKRRAQPGGRTGRPAGAGGRRGSIAEPPRQSPLMVPIETPLMFSGFDEHGCATSGRCSISSASRAVQGGGAASATEPPSPRPAGSIRCIPAKQSRAYWSRAI